jgi:ankyrin repeat protein
MTPLHAAVLADNRETVALLIEKGANAAAANQSGATPLDTAAQNGDKDMMKLLRQHIHQKKKAVQ